MAYVPNNNKLVMKIVPTTMGDAGDGLGGVWDAIGAAIGGAANYVKSTQAPPPVGPPVAQTGGIDTSTLLLLGALGLGGFFVYKKMKKKR